HPGQRLAQQRKAKSLPQLWKESSVKFPTRY
ncbi:MAG: hypothetical protein ACJATG_002103, partial [Dinoroseobacter sp.]